MKERIYTIPLNDALDEGGECFVCNLERALEENGVKYVLGPSMMEPDTRIMTNQMGFCRRHYHSISQLSNQLGLALVLETHLGDLLERLDSLEIHKKHTFGRQISPVGELCRKLDEWNESCFVCTRLEEQMTQALNNLVYLWDSEPQFRLRINASRGVCLHHMPRVLCAADGLPPKKSEVFAMELLALQKAGLKTLYDDVVWFTKKFDYRNEQAPWGNSKDAVARALARLAKY